MSGSSIFESRKFKTIMKFVYGWGGAIVIVGALFKILHLPGPMLTIGLLVEAGIFILSAFEPLHEDPDWTLVYPELALGHSDDEHELPEKEEEEVLAVEEPAVDQVSVVEQLDSMLAEAKIEPELIESLGEGLRNLSNTASQLGNISDASVATEEFVGNIKSASDRVGKLSEAYETAATSLMGLTNTQEAGANFGEAMQKVSSNLSALNNVYEMQLKGASEQLETTEKLYSGINELMTNLHDSVDDTKKYKTTMAELSKNLAELNQVYGNMLSAMSGGNRA